MSKPRLFLLNLTLIWLAFLLTISGCSFPGGKIDSTPTAAHPTHTLTATPRPTVSPTPKPPRIILVAPDGSDQELFFGLESAVEALALKGGIEVDKVEGVVEGDLGLDVKLVIALPPDPGMQSLALAVPSAQFLAIGIPGLEISSNLSVIGADGFRPDQQGFIAGLAAVLSTDDWRVGVLALEGSTSSQAAMQGYINGVQYYCGRCIPAHPPYVSYPVVVSVKDPILEGGLVFDLLLEEQVHVVFVAREAASSEILLRFSQGGLSLIGGVTPQDTVILDSWIATVRPDPLPALESLWEDLMMGQGGFSEPMSFKLTQVDTASLSPGRQRLINELIHDLVGGVIDTGVDPNSGEAR